MSKRSSKQIRNPTVWTARPRRRGQACAALAAAMATAPAQPPTAAVAAPAAAPALPRGWRSAVDPRTSRTYYYNKKLGVRQWTPPTSATAAAAVPAVPAPARAAAPVSAPVSAAAPAPSPAPVDAGAAAPDGARQAAPSERAAAQVPTPGAVSGGAASGSATAGALVSPAAVPASAAMPAPARAAPLPVGWTEGVDPRTGAPYYFNAARGVTQWERPRPPPPPPGGMAPPSGPAPVPARATAAAAPAGGGARPPTAFPQTVQVDTGRYARCSGTRAARASGRPPLEVPARAFAAETRARGAQVARARPPGAAIRACGWAPG